MAKKYIGEPVKSQFAVLGGVGGIFVDGIIMGQGDNAK
jgi:hypothetical protein